MIFVCSSYEKQLNLMSWVKLRGIQDSCGYQSDSTSELVDSGNFLTLPDDVKLEVGTAI